MTKKMILLAAAALIMANGVGVSNAFAAQSMGGLNAPGMTAVDEDGDDDKEDGEGGGEKDTYKLTIENSTGKTITALFVGAAGEEDWSSEEDVMPDDGGDLEEGESVEITYTEEADEYDADKFDMKVEMDGDDMVFEDIDFENDEDGNHIKLNEDGTATLDGDGDDKDGDDKDE